MILLLHVKISLNWHHLKQKLNKKSYLNQLLQDLRKDIKKVVYLHFLPMNLFHFNTIKHKPYQKYTQSFIKATEES